MPAGVILKTAHGDLYDLRIKKQWVATYGEPEHEFEQFYRSDSITTEDTRFSYQTGFGLWNRTDLSEAVTYDTIYQGYDSTCTPYHYQLGFAVEIITEEDDPTGIVGTRLATELAISGRETLEYLAAVPYNNPTSTTGFSPYASGGDGVAMLSTVHPIPSGGYWSNCPSAHADISIATLQAAALRMDVLPNARGFIRGMPGKTVVIPPASRFLVAALLESEKTPFTTDNTKNVTAAGLTYKVWSQLTTGSGKWFLLADQASDMSSKGYKSTCVWRVRPQFLADRAFQTGDRLYKGRVRIGFINPDARGIDGSTGA